MSTIDIARSPLPDDVENYEGRWIAIRESKVVADAETLEELRSDERVKPTDVVYRVPERGSHVY